MRWWGLALLVVVAGSCRAPLYQCTSDANCAGGNVCLSGVCALPPECSPACAPFQDCRVVNSTTATCVSTVTLEWESSHVTFGPAQPLNARLTVLRSGQTAQPPGFSVPFTVQGPPQKFTLEQGAWDLLRADPVLTPSAHWTVVAGWPDGGPTASLDLTYDAVPPTVAIVTADGGSTFAGLRDSTARAWLLADEPVHLANDFDGGVRLRDPAACGAGGPDASYCLEADLWTPADDLSSFVLADDVQNTSNVSYRIDRLKWYYSVGNEISALAVMPDGTLVVGTSVEANDGGSNIIFLSPDGSAQSRVNPNRTRAITVGDRLDFVMSNASGGFLTSVTFDFQQSEATSSRQVSNSAPALLHDQSGLEHSILAWNPGDSHGSILQSFAVGTDGGTRLERPTDFVHWGEKFPIPIVAQGTQALVLSGNPSKGVAPVLQTVELSGGQPSLVLSQPLGTVDLLSYAQALAPGGRTLVSLTSNGLDGGIASVSPTDLRMGNYGAVGPAVVVSAHEAWVATADSLLKFDPQAPDQPLQTISLPFGNQLLWSPIIGVGRGERVLYAVGFGGEMFAVNLASGAVKAMNVAGDASAHPTFDCNRTAPNTQTGIVYVGTTDGYVLATIVDSPKLLDTAESWPKFQRTQGNAGNDDRVNYPTNWPACQ